MQNVFLTSLTTPEVRQLLREELESFFPDKISKTETSEFLSVQHAALFLDKTPNALRVMVHKNQISYFKKLGKLYFKKADLISWVESGKITITEDLNAEGILIKKSI